MISEHYFSFPSFMPILVLVEKVVCLLCIKFALIMSLLEKRIKRILIVNSSYEKILNITVNVF